MKTAALFLQAFVTYIVVDVAYQALVGLRLGTYFIEQAGLQEVFVMPNATGVAMMVVFFILIAWANLELVILPAIRDKDVGRAFRHGALLGAACYGTLGLSNGWSLRGFMPGQTAAIMAEGIAFSMITSGVTTWTALRRG